MSLAYATSNRGGCHLRAYPVSHEILRKPVANRQVFICGQGAMIKIAEDLNAVVDFAYRVQVHFFCGRP